MCRCILSKVTKISKVFTFSPPLLFLSRFPANISILHNNKHRNILDRNQIKYTRYASTRRRGNSKLIIQGKRSRPVLCEALGYLSDLILNRLSVGRLLRITVGRRHFENDRAARVPEHRPLQSGNTFDGNGTRLLAQLAWYKCGDRYMQIDSPNPERENVKEKLGFRRHIWAFHFSSYNKMAISHSLKVSFGHQGDQLADAILFQRVMLALERNHQVILFGRMEHNQLISSG